MSDRITEFYQAFNRAMEAGVVVLITPEDSGRGGRRVSVTVKNPRSRRWSAPREARSLLESAQIIDAAVHAVHVIPLTAEFVRDAWQRSHDDEAGGCEADVQHKTGTCINPQCPWRHDQ